MSGKEILNLMSLNASVRVFERVGTAPRRSRAEYTPSPKPDLFDDWRWPASVPEDLYRPTFGGSDYQWVILSQPQTGTHIHQDPVMTDAWNALISGHKVRGKRLMYKKFRRLKLFSRTVLGHPPHRRER